MVNRNSGNSAQWVDLIAFLGVLSLGGILVVAVGMTTASLATTCVALAGLYAAFKRFRIPSEFPQTGDSDPMPVDAKIDSHET